jgi:hypothetical protein
VTYVAALCVERRKRDGTFLPEGTNTPIDISLTEAGRYADDGWHMTGEEQSKLRVGDLVPIHEDSGELWRARYMGEGKFFSAKGHLRRRDERKLGGVETNWNGRTTPVVHLMEPITDEERRRDAELEALRRKITEQVRRILGPAG